MIGQIVILVFLALLFMDFVSAVLAAIFYHSITGR